MPSPDTIPTPLAERWREFKQQVLPGIVFAAAVLAAGLLWRNYVMPVSLVGRIETAQASVSGPKPGSLTRLRVTRFQPVALGATIAQILTTGPQILAASLAIIRAEIELLRAKLVDFTIQEPGGDYR